MHIGTLQLQQCFLPLDATAIAGKAAVCTHHTVARDDERKIQLLKLEGTDCIKLFVPKKCELRVEQAQSKGEQKM